MALQSSGAISLNEIHIEAGGSTGTTATINDADIRGLISKSSEATMSFNEWYGAANLNTRAVTGGSWKKSNANFANTIDYIDIASTGNSTDFGNLTASRTLMGACSSLTRCVFAGGNVNRNVGSYDGTRSNEMQYITIASTGNATDFGDLGNARDGVAGFSNTTRGVFAGGGAGNNFVFTRYVELEYITIASTGNITDFGDLTVARQDLAGCGSSTRGISAGGGDSSGNAKNEIDYVTIASTGNATDFGNLSTTGWSLGGASNSTRGVFFGRNINQAMSSSSHFKNNIDYITIASTGNATDFGDLTGNRCLVSAAASDTRACCFGGAGQNQSASNDGLTERDFIEYVTIASTGNSTDFGNLTDARMGTASASGAHGGL